MRPHTIRRTGPSVAAIAILAWLAVSGCGGQSPGRTSAPVEGQLPDQVVSDFVATETDEGALQWKMYARQASTYKASNLVVAQAVRVDFFDEKGERSSALTANEGDMNDLTHDMTAKGNVVIQGTEGTRMTTDQIHFNNKKQRIETDSFVRVERAGDVLTGWGFESDPELKDFQFKRQVKATVRSKSGGIVESNKGASH